MIRKLQLLAVLNFLIFQTYIPQFVRMMLNLGVGYDIDDKSCDSKVWSCYNNSVVNTSEHNSYTNNSGPVSSVCDIDT